MLLPKKIMKETFPSFKEAIRVDDASLLADDQIKTLAQSELPMAMPSRGELYEGSMTYLSSLGWDTSLLTPETRVLAVEVGPGVTVVKLRAPDIIDALRENAITMGILGNDVIVEELLNPNPTPLVRLRRLGFGGCSFRMGFRLNESIPSGNEIFERMKEARIATSLPNTLTSILRGENIVLQKNQLRTLTGSVEAALALYPGVFFVADRVSSGESMRSNGIRADLALWESDGAYVVTTKKFAMKNNLLF